MKEIKTITIKCESKDVLNIAEMTEFQGNLKARTDIDYDKIKLSIIKYGFSFPFFIWKDEGKNYLLDGHGRFATLCKMQKDGYIIPDLPVVYVDCKDEAEAKQKLLRLNSQYGKMTSKSVLDFIGEEEIEIEELSLPKGFLDFEKVEEIEESPEEEFAQELGEENNYLVLFFDSTIDWLQVQSLFELKRVKALKSTDNFQQKGVGRVINGTQFIKKMLEAEEMKRGEK
ncbi:MAG: hypothetical protein MJ179_02490 [Treponema sp.]|nr:hypothetical protein [Treponema sp.]